MRLSLGLSLLSEGAYDLSALPDYVASIEQLTAREHNAMRGRSWHANCGCPELGELVRLELSHWDFAGQAVSGQLIVARDVASDLLGVFEQLFAARFPIEKMRPIHLYDGDDERSMADNNSSAFNCRPKTGKSELSVHSFGRAIDINPVQNPYQTQAGVLIPEAGRPYANPFRHEQRHPGMIHSGSTVVRVFSDIGWAWGGDWDDPKDWQHFERV